MKNKILIIEDNKTLSDALEILLQDEGFETLAVKDGLRGYLRSHLWAPDLILMDYFIENATGGEVARNIEDTHVPIIFMTGSDKPEVEEDIKKYKPAGFFKKPLDVDKLLYKIKSII